MKAFQKVTRKQSWRGGISILLSIAMVMSGISFMPGQAQAFTQARGSMTGFEVGISYVGIKDDDWAEQCWNTAETLEITEDGSYDFVYQAEEAADDVLMIMLNTNLYSGSLGCDFKLSINGISVGNQDYAKVEDVNGWGYIDLNTTKAYRYNIRNPYMGPVAEDGENTADISVTSTDLLGGAVIPVEAGQNITIHFTVSGMDSEVIKPDVSSSYVWKGKAHGDCFEVVTSGELEGMEPQTDSRDFWAAAGYNYGLEVVNPYNEVAKSYETAFPEFYFATLLKQMEHPMLVVTTQNGGDAYFYDWSAPYYLQSGVAVDISALKERYISDRDSFYLAFFSGEDTITQIELYEGEKSGVVTGPPVSFTPQPTNTPLPDHTKEDTAEWIGTLCVDETGETLQYTTETDSETFSEFTGNNWSLWGGTGSTWAAANLTAQMDLSSYDAPVVKVEGTAQYDVDESFVVSVEDGITGDKKEETYDVTSGTFTVTAPLYSSAKTKLLLAPYSSEIVIKKITVCNQVSTPAPTDSQADILPTQSYVPAGADDQDTKLTIRRKLDEYGCYMQVRMKNEETGEDLDIVWQSCFEEWDYESTNHNVTKFWGIFNTAAFSSSYLHLVGIVGDGQSATLSVIADGIASSITVRGAFDCSFDLPAKDGMEVEINLDNTAATLNQFSLCDGSYVKSTDYPEPSDTPTVKPSSTPTVKPTATVKPSSTPTVKPSSTPTVKPTETVKPSSTPTATPAETPNTDTSIKIDEETGFRYRMDSNYRVIITGYEDKTVTSLVVPEEIDGKAVKELGASSFYNYRLLENVVLPESLEVIGSMAFATCWKLSQINLPDSVYEIGYRAFEGCALTSLELPKALQTIGHEIIRTEDFKEITIDASNEYYKSVDGVLYSKDGKKVVWVPSGKESITFLPTVKEFGEYALYGSVVEDLEIPEGVEKIQSWCFFSSDIQSITLPATVKDIEVSQGNPFCWCTSLQNIIVSEENEFYTSVEGVLYSKDKTVLIAMPGARESYQIPDGVAKIGDGAFFGSRISDLGIPETVTEIGQNAFYESRNLEKITLPEGIKLGRSCFSSTSLIEMNLPENAVLGSDVFYNCGYLQYIYAPESVQLKAINGEESYSDPFWTYTGVVICTTKGSAVDTYALEKGYTVVYDTSSIVEEAGMRFVVDGEEAILVMADIELKYLFVPEEVQGIPVTTIGKYAIKSEYVILPDTITKINKYALQYVDEVYIPESVTTIEAQESIGKIYTPSDSYAEQWAQQKGISVENDKPDYSAYAVESISVKPYGVLYEGFNGTQKEGYFKYDPYKEIDVTITYMDGSSKMYSTRVLEDENGRPIGADGNPGFYGEEVIANSAKFVTNQSAKNPWGIGKHTVKASWQGICCEYEVEVVENPVDYIVVEPSKVQLEQEQILNPFLGVDVIIYFKDGRIIHSASSGYYGWSDHGDYSSKLIEDWDDMGLYLYGINYLVILEHQPWDVDATNLVTASFLGKTTTFEVMFANSSTETPEPTKTPPAMSSTKPTSTPTITETPESTPQLTENPSATDEPKGTDNPEETASADATQTPSATGAPSGGNASRPTPTPIPKTTLNPVVSPKPVTGDKIEPDDTENVSEVVLGDGENVAITKGSNVASVKIGSVQIDGKEYKVTEIKKGAYKNKKKLKKIVIGKSVKKIGANAFSGCSNLKTVIFLSEKAPAIGKNAFKNINKKAKIYVPKKALKQYKKNLKTSTGYKKTMKIIGR